MTKNLGIFLLSYKILFEKKGKLYFQYSKSRERTFQTNKAIALYLVFLNQKIGYLNLPIDGYEQPLQILFFSFSLTIVLNYIA